MKMILLTVASKLESVSVLSVPVREVAPSVSVSGNSSRTIIKDISFSGCSTLDCTVEVSDVVERADLKQSIH